MGKISEKIRDLKTDRKIQINKGYFYDVYVLSIFGFWLSTIGIMALVIFVVGIFLFETNWLLLIPYAILGAPLVNEVGNRINQFCEDLIEVK